MWLTGLSGAGKSTLAVALERRLFDEGRFTEVFVNAPLEVCEQRDPKGLYAKARAGELRDFTGISSPYEPPALPEIEVRTDQLSVVEAVECVLAFLKKASS